MNRGRVLSVSACFIMAVAAALEAQSPKQNAGKQRGAAPPRKTTPPAASPQAPPARNTTAAADRSLDARIAAVLPTEEEDRWLEIKWRTNIAEARAEAARENKPVFLWVMNGNPIGCG
jgi:hypothetical protein